LAAVIEEVEAGQSHLAEPGVSLGELERIDGERTTVVARLDRRLQDLGPLGRAATSERGDVGRVSVMDRPCALPLVCSILNAKRPEGETERMLTGWNRQAQVAVGSARPDRSRHRWRDTAQNQ